MAKKQQKVDKHHGVAGDGNELIPIKADGTPAKWDKYGNLVTENTGKGKGIMLKEQYANASKNLTAPSPEDIVKGLTRPYWSINDMPITYIYNSIIEYLNSILEPVYKRVPVLDEENNPLKTSDGKEILQTVLVNYNYKQVPTRYGLAQALGVDLTTLDNYLRINNTNTNSSIDNSGNNSISNGYTVTHQNTYVNRDNKLIDISKIDYDSVLYKIYGDDVLYDDSVRERLGRKTEKDIKIFLLKRARIEIMKFHEQRLGVNENVTGSMFALLNSRDGWTNDHTVKIEFPDLLGKTKTVDEIEKMVEYEADVIVLDEKDGEFVPAKDIDLDGDDY